MAICPPGHFLRIPHEYRALAFLHFGAKSELDPVRTILVRKPATCSRLCHPLGAGENENARMSRGTWSSTRSRRWLGVVPKLWSERR